MDTEHDNFRDYWLSLNMKDRTQLAEKAGTSVGYLNHVSTGVRNAGINTVIKLQKVDSMFTVEFMRKRPEETKA